MTLTKGTSDLVSPKKSSFLSPINGPLPTYNFLSPASGTLDVTGGTATASDGTVYVVGVTVRYKMNSSDFAAGVIGGFLLKYSSTGSPQWVERWNNSAFGRPSVVIMGGFVYVASSAMITIGNQVSSVVVIMQFDTSGNIKWEATWSVSSKDASYGIAASPVTNRIYVVTDSLDIFGVTYQAFLLTVDTSGNIIHQEAFPTCETKPSPGGTSLCPETGLSSVLVTNNGAHDEVYVAGAVGRFVNGLGHLTPVVGMYQDGSNLMWVNLFAYPSGPSEAAGLAFVGDGSLYVYGTVFAPKGDVFEAILGVAAGTIFEVAGVACDAFSVGLCALITGAQLIYDIPNLTNELTDILSIPSRAVGAALYLVGLFQGYQDITEALTQTPHPFVAMMSSSGSVLWSSTIQHSSQSGVALALAPNPQGSGGGLYLAASANNPSGIAPGLPNGTMIIGLTSSGAITTQAAIGNSAKGPSNQVSSIGLSSSGQVEVFGTASAMPSAFDVTDSTVDSTVPSGIGPQLPSIYINSQYTFDGYDVLINAVTNPSASNPGANLRFLAVVNNPPTGSSGGYMELLSAPVPVTFASSPSAGVTFLQNGDPADVLTSASVFPGASINVAATATNNGVVTQAKGLFFSWSDSSGALIADPANYQTYIQVLSSTVVEASFGFPTQIGPAGSSNDCVTFSPLPNPWIANPSNCQGNTSGQGTAYYPLGQVVQECVSSSTSSYIFELQTVKYVGSNPTPSSPPTCVTFREPTALMTGPWVVQLVDVTSNPMKFSETGLPTSPPPNWIVTLTAYSASVNGTLLSANYSPTANAGTDIVLTGFASNTYSYSVSQSTSANGCNYAPGTPSGKYPVGAQRVTVTFTVKNCNVTFTETGLPPGSSWSAVLGGATKSSTTNTITFNAQPLKQARYSVKTSTANGCRYNPSPTSSYVSPPTTTTVPVTFTAVSCTIVFSESGLPLGTSWSATLDTTTMPGTGSTITFTNVSPTTHTWSVNSPSGSTGSLFVPTSSTGSFTAPATTTVPIQYTQEWRVTFTESGFSGTWSVTFAGKVYSSAINQILTDYYPVGTYSWSASYPPCGSACQYSPSPSSGPISIPAQLSQSITYSNQFLVSFAISPANGGGTAPSGPVWVTMGSSIPIKAITDVGGGYAFSSWTSSSSSITIACPTCASTTATVVSIGSGTLTANFKTYFSISLSPTSGSIGQGGSLTSTVTLNLLSGSPYPVTLSASGLPSGASASFTNNPCTPKCTSTMTLSTSGSTPTGTYAVTITGTDTNGVAVTATYSLTVTQVMGYTITFTETGLPAGTSWTVTFNGQAYSSTTSTISFQTPAGTFNWSVTDPISGVIGVQYSASQAQGAMPVPTYTSMSIVYTQQYQVALTVGSGTGSTSPSGTVWVNAGSGLTISATPGTNYAFSSWSASSSITLACSTCSSTTATVNGPGTITANFVPVAQTYWVSFSESGLGGSANWCVSLGPFGQQCAPPGSSIVFYGVSPGSYSYSVSYVGCGTGCQSAPSPSSGTVSVNGNTNVYINFTTQYYVTVLLGGTFVIGDTASGAGWYNAGSSATISASTGGTCSTFMGWTGNAYTGLNTSQTFTVSGAVTETANFKNVC